VLRAFDEDKRTLGPRDAKKALASRLKDDLLGFVSLVVDNNYLGRFNRHSGTRVGHTSDLLSRMNEVEKLLFAKIITTKKNVGFHRDIYTKILLHDNMKSLCLLLESNLKRRLKGGTSLGQVVARAFNGEPWIANYVSERRRREQGLSGYQNISDFNRKVQRIRNYRPFASASDNFHLQNFLTATLVRNLTAHVLEGPITTLRGLREYDSAFARIAWSLLYSLNYVVH
jgi:hypothetical protein